MAFSQAMAVAEASSSSCCILLLLASASPLRSSEADRLSHEVRGFDSVLAVPAGLQTFVNPSSTGLQLYPVKTSLKKVEHYEIRQA